MKNQINLEMNNQCSENFKKNQFKTLKRKFNLWSKIGLVCIALFSLSTIQAQTTDTLQNQEKNITVQGNVSNDSGPLYGVSIFLEGTTIGVSTNSKGDFKFPKQLKKGDVLVFSSVGLKSQKVVIDNVNSASNIELKVDMLLTEIEIMGSAAGKKVYKSKR